MEKNQNKKRNDSTNKNSGLESSFARFLIESGAVKFGSFKLKSGRVSPYFINLGLIGDGTSVSRLGEFYARAFVEKGLAAKTDVLFGPSYKGIPIAVSAAIALSNIYGKSLRFAFNRKEAKDHGEGGLIIGGGLRDGDRIGLLDDVMTTGKTKEEVLEVIRVSAKAEIAYVLIAVDRLERGESETNATREFEEKYGIPVFSIATIEDIARSAKAGGLISEQELQAVGSYLKEYGGKR
jgi:orotate phosphoribosyltransferase